jgi:hypothetical protein
MSAFVQSRPRGSSGDCPHTALTPIGSAGASENPWRSPVYIGLLGTV